MRVLVTGHNGYIGSVLVPRFEQAGHEIFGIDSDLFAACTFGPDVPEVAGTRMDVRDIESEDLVGFDAVVHLAAVCNDPVGNLNPQGTYDQPSRVRAGRREGQAGGGLAVPLLILVQPLTARPATRCWTRVRGSPR